jgi:4-methyl-5(b-hydroxyethyl)-thiazole monophosphate biosynthesis
MKKVISSIAVVTLLGISAHATQLYTKCAAPIALDRAGVLKEEYTCYPGVPDVIKSSKFVEKTIVESQNVITSRGPGTAICFGLYIIEKLVDKETAEAVKGGMLAAYCY